MKLKNVSNLSALMIPAGDEYYFIIESRSSKSKCFVVYFCDIGITYLYLTYVKLLKYYLFLVDNLYLYKLLFVYTYFY